MSNPHSTHDTTVLTTFEQDAIDLIEDGATSFEVIRDLPLHSLDIYEDHAADWHYKYALEPLVRALFWRALMGWSMSRLHAELQEYAIDLGFDSGKFATDATAPSRTTLGRAWRDRFGDDLHEFITRRTEWILEHAHDRGNPLGLRALEPAEKSDLSKATEERFIREKSREVTTEMRELVFPQLDLDRPDSGTRYEDAAFLALQSLLSLNEVAAENGGNLLADRDGTENAPDADTHLHYIKQLSADQITAFVTDGVEAMLEQAKRHLEFKRPVELAIDATSIEIPGDHRELEMAMGTRDPEDDGSRYRFATASIVGENVKFTLAMRPIKKGETIGEVVRELYWQAREHVSIKMVYADREFYSADVIRTLNETGSKYIIAVPQRKRLKREVQRMSNDVKVTDWALYGPVAGEPGDTRVETTMAFVPKRRDDEAKDETESDDEDEQGVATFATNLDIDDELRLDREETKGWINRYSRRWGIESSYRSIKEFLAWTTSSNFRIRYFYFGCRVALRYVVARRVRRGSESGLSRTAGRATDYGEAVPRIR